MPGLPGVHAQPVSVGIQGNEGVAERQRGGRLRDGQAAARPVGVQRFHGLHVGHREYDLHPRAPALQQRRDVVPCPEPEPQAGVQDEQREVGRVLDRIPAEQAGIEGGAGLRRVDVEDDEIGIGHVCAPSW